MERCSVLIVFALATACGPGADGPNPGDEMQLRVGIGRDCFDEYQPGGSLYLQRGFQGGQHINTTILTSGPEEFVDCDVYASLVDPATAATVIGPDQRVGYFEPALRVEPAQDEGTVIMRGLYLFVPEPDEVLGKSLELYVSVFTPDGQTSTWSVAGVPAWMPDDYNQSVATWCERMAEQLAEDE